MDSIGVGIREIRNIFEMSREDLAIVSGLTEDFVALCEDGLIEPTIDDVNAIATALSIPVSYIVMFSNQADDPLLNKFKEVTRKVLQLGAERS